MVTKPWKDTYAWKYINIHAMLKAVVQIAVVRSIQLHVYILAVHKNISRSFSYKFNEISLKI